MHRSIEYTAKELFLLGQRRPERVTFHGPTMLPFLRDGDQITIRPVEWKRIRTGDIITYRFRDRFPTCRVMRRRGDRLVLKADNWPQFSAEIGEQDVIGRVVQLRRNSFVLHRHDWRWRLYTVRWLVRDRAKRSRFVTAAYRLVKAASHRFRREGHTSDHA